MHLQRIVFLGSKSIGAFCLAHLLRNKKRYNIEILAAVTKPNPSLDNDETVENMALKNDIPLLSGVREIPYCDVIISVQHHEILKQTDIDKATTIAINLHMAPLPEYRGCNQFSFAIIDNKKEFGTTLHQMTTGIDDGDIIAERRFEIASDIWVDELYERTLLESKLLFEGNIEKILKGDYVLTTQASLIEARGCAHHYRKEIDDIKIIDERWTTEQKLKHVRATFKEGFEPPYAIVNGEKKYYNKSSF